jgi:hypothetical protein
VVYFQPLVDSKIGSDVVPLLQKAHCGSEIRYRLRHLQADIEDRQNELCTLITNQVCFLGEPDYLFI